MINVSLLLSGSVRKPGRLYPRPSSSLFQAFQISRKIRNQHISPTLHDHLSRQTFEISF